MNSMTMKKQKQYLLPSSGLLTTIYHVMMRIQNGSVHRNPWLLMMKVYYSNTWRLPMHWIAKGTQLYASLVPLPKVIPL